MIRLDSVGVKLVMIAGRVVGLVTSPRAAPVGAIGEPLPLDPVDEISGAGRAHVTSEGNLWIVYAMVAPVGVVSFSHRIPENDILRVEVPFQRQMADPLPANTVRRLKNTQRPPEWSAHCLVAGGSSDWHP